MGADHDIELPVAITGQTRDVRLIVGASHEKVARPIIGPGAKQPVRNGPARRKLDDLHRGPDGRRQKGHLQPIPVCRAAMRTEISVQVQGFPLVQGVFDPTLTAFGNIGRRDRKEPFDPLAAAGAPKRRRSGQQLYAQSHLGSIIGSQWLSLNYAFEYRDFSSLHPPNSIASRISCISRE